MVTRRKFLGSLAGLTALTALAGAGIRLPRREDVEVDVNPYLTSKDAWYLKDWPGRYSNNLAHAAELSEQSLQDILNQMKDNASFVVRPNKMIVPPHLAERAHYLLTRPPPGLIKRLWNWLTVSA